jgi:hypothetical protein
MKLFFKSAIFLLLFYILSLLLCVINHVICATTAAEEKAGKPLYAPIKPKESPAKNTQQLQATKDWDLVYRLLNRVSNSNFGNGIRRSVQNVSGLEVLGSLFYGLSMAAGLALGVSMADANIVSALSKRVDHRFMQKRNQIDKSVSKLMSGLPLSLGGGSKDKQSKSELALPSEPILQKYVAPSKDGKDHYHHVVHYHVPYPLSIGALETARQNYPQVPWFNSHNPNNPEKAVLSGYLGVPSWIPAKNTNEHQQSLVGQNNVAPQVVAMPNMIELANSFVQDDQSLRRNDYQVFSDSEYFKNLNTKQIKTSVKQNNQQNPRPQSPTTATPGLQNHHQNNHQNNRLNSFEDMFFEQHSHHKPIVQEIRQQGNPQHLPQLVTLDSESHADHSLMLQNDHPDVMDFSNYHPAMTIESMQSHSNPSSGTSSASSEHSVINTTLSPFQQ